MYPLVEDMSKYILKIYARPPGAPAPVVVCLVLADYSMANRKIAYTLAEDGHIFLTCPELVGTWVQNIFRNLVPDFWTCPTAKKGHIYKGGWISVVRRVFTGGVIIMESRVFAN